MRNASHQRSTIKTRCQGRAGDDAYVPAIGAGSLLRLYDPLLRWTTREQTIKRRLIEEAHLKSREQILDLGCGTGTLALLVKSARPDADVIGLDGDAKILAIARAKVARSAIKIQLHLGLAQVLPYPDASFDQVFSTLFFHHLTHSQKIKAIQEVFRVLRPGGELHVADWGKPQNWLMRFAFKLVEWGDGKERTSDNRDGLLPQMIESAGFAPVRGTRQYMTLFGTLCLFHAQKPA